MSPPMVDGDARRAAAADARTRELALSALATGLCHDADLAVVVHDGAWCYMPERRAIGVPRADLVRLGEEACAGIIAHEVGHARVSRYHAWLREREPAAMWALVLNAIEDVRCEAWMCARYPGVRSWLATARGASETRAIQAPTMFVAALLAAAATAEDGAPGASEASLTAPPASDASRRVRAVLDATREARSRYARTRPSAMADEVAVFASAKEAFELASRAIVPHFAELWHAESLANEAFVEGGGVVDGGRGLELGENAPARRAPPSDSGEYATKLTPLAPTLAFALDGYEELYRDVAGLVDTLARNLEEHLAPRRRLRLERGFAQGRRVDLRALMASEADPSRPPKPFMRPNIPDRRTAAFGLLIDLSGSMRREKIQAALRGACLMAEVLARLDVPFRMDGFQDELIPIVDFHQGLGPALRATLPELALEPEGQRVGGHNDPRRNDDGPCLLAAADHLLAYPAHDHFLIVISDGQPHGRHSTPRDLVDAVASLTARGLAPVGIGLGPDTSHVADYYRHHLAEVPLAELARRLGGVVGDLLRYRGPVPPTGTFVNPP